MANVRCLRAALELIAITLVVAALTAAAAPQTEEVATSPTGETDFEALLRRLGEAHAAPEHGGDSFSDLLQQVRAEHAKALSRADSLYAELAEAKALLGLAPSSPLFTPDNSSGAAAAVEAASTAAVVAAPGFRVEGQQRRFLAPAPAAPALPPAAPLRQLQILDPAAYGSGVSVFPFELNGDRDMAPVPMQDVPDASMPVSTVAQFGYNLCRNGNQNFGGCCQQIASRCCTAHSRRDSNWRWQMCFNDETRMLRVHTAGRDTFEILAAQVATMPAAFHARWVGPNDACFPTEDFTIYAFNR